MKLPLSSYVFFAWILIAVHCLADLEENFDQQYVSPTEIRKMFASALSEMYASEIPKYLEFVEIVKTSNEEFLKKNPNTTLDNYERVIEEKHGAVRVSTPEEMHFFAKAFKIMNMYPVEFYDLTKSNIPMISTAFRPIDDSINEAPFRMFTSMLHPDYIPIEVKEEIDIILNIRKNNPKFSLKLIDLTNLGENRPLTLEEARQFATEFVNALKLEKNKAIDFNLYKILREKNDVYADNICVGININHLTPRAFDIQDAQKKLESAGIPMKNGGIEGPPMRKNAPNLQLNQTSRKAPGELIPATNNSSIIQLFYNNKILYDQLLESAPTLSMQPMQTIENYLASAEDLLKTHPIIFIEHKSRFGEIESRHTALTEKGEALLQSLLNKNSFEEEFPNTHLEMFKKDLAYYTFAINKFPNTYENFSFTNIYQLIEEEYITLIPQTYEDFLAVSAAGIFQSNMSNGIKGIDQTQSLPVKNNKLLLESAIGHEILSRHELSTQKQLSSMKDIEAILSNQPLSL